MKWVAMGPYGLIFSQDGATGSRKVSIYRDTLKKSFGNHFDIDFKKDHYNHEEESAIAEMETSKYLNREWIYQNIEVPDLSGETRQMTPAGLIDVRVTMAGRQIKAVFIGGDFFAGESAVADIEGSLRWHSSEPEAIGKTLDSIYSRREEELSFLPVEVLTDTVLQAIESAKTMSDGNTKRYGCFVNP